jgi:hypothetical protein
MLRGVASPARAERVGLAYRRHLAGLTTADSDPWILMAARAYCRRLTEHAIGFAAVISSETEAQGTGGNSCGLS